MKIIIVGAGLTGLETALHLIDKGHEPVLVEALPNACQKASYTAAGLIGLPSLPPPAPEAGRIGRIRARRTGTEGLLYSSSQAIKHPGFVNALAKERRPERIAAKADIRRELALKAAVMLRAEAGALGLDLLESAGSIVINPSEGTGPGSEGGHASKPLGLDAVLPIEPSLMAATGIESVSFLREATWSVSYYARQLKDVLLEKKGVQLLVNRRVVDFIRRDDAIVGVATSQGDVMGDAVVLATGPETTDLLPEKALFNAPTAPVSRSMLSIEMIGEVTRPRHSVVFEDGRAVAPTQNFLRLMGCWHLGLPEGYDVEAACRALWQTGIDLFPESADWHEGRYLTQSVLACADGMALVGATAWPGLYVNVAGGAHGADLAPVYAETLADVVSGVENPFAEGLSPSRFA